jgi:hypothetical protein
LPLAGETAPPHVPLPPNSCGVPSIRASCGIQHSMADPDLDALIMPIGTEGRTRSRSLAANQQTAAGYLLLKSVGPSPDRPYELLLLLLLLRAEIVPGSEAAQVYGAFEGQSMAEEFPRPVGTGHGRSAKFSILRFGIEEASLSAAPLKASAIGYSTAHA